MSFRRWALGTYHAPSKGEYHLLWEQWVVHRWTRLNSRSRPHQKQSQRFPLWDNKQRSFLLSQNGTWEITKLEILQLYYCHKETKNEASRLEKARTSKEVKSPEHHLQPAISVISPNVFYDYLSHSWRTPEWWSRLALMSNKNIFNYYVCYI